MSTRVVLTIDTTSNDRGTVLKCDRMNGCPRGERTVAKNGDMHRSREGGGVKMPEFCERLLRTNTAHM